MSDEPKPLADWLRTEALYLDGNPDWTGPLTTVTLLRDAAEEIDRLATLETALRTIQEAMVKYVHPERTMTAEEFIDVVLGAADHQDVVRAMRKADAP